MLIFALESSAKSASVAVLGDGKVLGERYLDTGLKHSQTLLVMAEGLLDDLGISVSELELIAAAAGPGSFTGVRIGIACAKGLAMPHDIPCCGVSTLEACAVPGRLAEGSLICAAMDARRGQVYSALFSAKRGELHRLTEDRVVSVTDLKDELAERYPGRDVLLFGDGAGLLTDTHARLAPAELRLPRASSVAVIAQMAASRGETVPAERLEPVYLRPPQAERELRERGEKSKDGDSI